MRRLFLLLGVLALLVVCCGAPSESTEESLGEPTPTPAAAASSTSDYDACVADCKASDHPGCEQACSASGSIDCAFAPPGIPSERRSRGLPPQKGTGGTAGTSSNTAGASSGVSGGGTGGGTAGAGGASLDPSNADDCTCVGEIPPQCASVCAPPEKEHHGGGGGLNCSFAPPR